MVISIIPARTGKHIDDARFLFRHYAEWLEAEHDISLEFQGIDEELASLPGKYAPPVGELLVAYSEEDELLGSVAIRKFRDHICEIKRLYLLPAARGQSLGKTLVGEIINCAKDIGYSEAVLDTGPFMLPAQRVYESFGFSDIPPYYHNPFEGVRFMGAKL